MTDFKPTVSIIIPVYNGGKAFEQCVTSLKNIDYSLKKLEIIIVNDGSTDDTSNIVKSVIGLERFKLIEHNKNKGRAAARNSGVKASNGEVIIFLDADMAVMPNFVSEHIKALFRPGVVAVSGKVDIQKTGSLTSLERYLYKYKKRGAQQIGEKKPIPFKYLITGNMSIKKTVLSECGYFDESYIGYGGEDTDFAIRLWELYPLGVYYSEKAISYDLQDEQLDQLLDKMNRYGRTNYIKLLNEHPNYICDMGGDWIASLKGYIVFNQIAFLFVKIIYVVFPHPFIIRYLIAQSLIKGARKSNMKTIKNIRKNDT